VESGLKEGVWLEGEDAEIQKGQSVIQKQAERSKRFLAAQTTDVNGQETMIT